MLLEPAGAGSPRRRRSRRPGAMPRAGCAGIAGVGARVRGFAARHLRGGPPLPSALIQAAAKSARERRIPRHGLGRRRTAHAGLRAIPRAASASADLRSSTRCAAGGGRRARPRLARFGRRSSPGLCGGRGLPRRRSPAMRSRARCANGRARAMPCRRGDEPSSAVGCIVLARTGAGRRSRLRRAAGSRSSPQHGSLRNWDPRRRSSTPGFAARWASTSARSRPKALRSPSSARSTHGWPGAAALERSGRSSRVPPVRLA